MAGIRLAHVTKRFPDGTEAVADADFHIEDGEFFILVGPSGCGKSTLLNMIVGLESVTEGEIRVDDRLVNDIDPRDRNMAMVFQSYAIYPHMTVRENLAFPLKLARLPKREVRRRVEHAADLLELGSLLERRPASLSGGQRQRVAMGRALVREPQAFLMDEPLSNLDAKLRGQMRTEIARLQRRLGTTTVYVTHDQTEAMTLGDRIAVLRQGRIQQIGTPRELYNQPANLFVAGFIGAPAMNFLPAEVEHDRLRLPFGDLELPDKLRHALPDDTTELIVGIRPEHISTAKEQDHAHMEVQAELTEWLGADQYVHFRLEITSRQQEILRTALDADIVSQGGIPCVARQQAAANVDTGDRVRLALDPEKLHLFDSDSGADLTADM